MSNLKQSQNALSAAAASSSMGNTGHKRSGQS